MIKCTQLPLFPPDTIEIPLTKGYVAIVDWSDRDLAEKKWSSQVTKVNCYAISHHKRGETLILHRIVLERALGRCLAIDEYVDHINGNGLDNRRENLRVATKTQNNRNKAKSRSNKSGYKGVWRDKGKVKERWQAGITANGKKIHLGRFDTREEAHEAYCKAAIELHGEFARLE